MGCRKGGKLAICFTGNGGHLGVDNFLGLVRLAVLQQLADASDDLETGLESVLNLLANELREGQGQS